jgi:branched-chain amino acid transport system substrate-binding protein
VRRACLVVAAIAILTLLGGPGAPRPAAGQAVYPKALRIAIVTFSSGQGAVVGGPTVNSARLTLDEINHAGGIHGVPIEAQYVDEAGGASHNVTEFRQLAAQGIDAAVGYVSSADCLAVAPVADELHVPTIFSDCTTNALFEGHNHPYVFRTIPPASTNALAGALYLLKTAPQVRTVAGINDDYAFGRDEWKYFTEALHQFRPEIQPVGALWPQLGAGNYTSEISRLLALHPDVVYSSLWGGDLIAFIQQALAQGLFQQSRVVLSLATEGDIKGLAALPAGVIGGSENTFLFHPGPIRDARLRQFVDVYRQRFGEYPVITYVYTIRNSLMALHAAYGKAFAASGGRWPTRGEVTAALAGLRLDTLLGPLVIRPDHQATYHEEYGTTVRTAQYPFTVFDQVIRFPAEMVMPPEGRTAEAFIASLKPDLLERVPAPVAYPVTR